MDQGEGHFVAKLKKHGSQVESRKKEMKTAVVPPFVTQFLKTSLSKQPAYLMESNGRVYAMEQPFLKLKDIRILRQGCQIGELIKNRLEPHQHFYVSNAYGKDILQSYEMNEDECLLFLQGQQLSVSGYKGYTKMLWHGYAVGFAKGDGTVLKNKYPKGLRIH